MINFSVHTEDLLLDIAKSKKIYLEGNILKVITSDSDNFNQYIKTCIDRDKESRRKRLAVTKEVQKKNKELNSILEDLHKSKEEADELRIEAEMAKEVVEQDLSNLQKKTQTELMSNIVNVALFVIVGVGVITTLMYMVAIIMNTETQVIGSTWSNLTGILLTNAFSIVGTIMGVKHATSDKNK